MFKWNQEADTFALIIDTTTDLSKDYNYMCSALTSQINYNESQAEIDEQEEFIDYEDSENYYHFKDIIKEVEIEHSKFSYSQPITNNKTQSDYLTSVAIFFTQAPTKYDIEVIIQNLIKFIDHPTVKVLGLRVASLKETGFIEPFYDLVLQEYDVDASMVSTTHAKYLNELQ